MPGLDPAYIEDKPPSYTVLVYRVFHLEPTADRPASDSATAPEGEIMIHYSCDFCGQPIQPDRQVRYVVRLEAYAALWEPDQPETEHDHLLEIEQILDALDDAQDASIGDDVYLKRHYDLCPRCYESFAKNPLGREIGRQMNYSGN